jgi:signal transduction histidine kinase
MPRRPRAEARRVSPATVHPIAPQAVAVQAAVEADRARTRAWLHDTVLQTLEYVAAGGYADAPDPAELIRAAAVAAAELRAYVEDEAPREGATLAERLRAAVADEQLLARHEIRLRLGPVDGSVEGEPARELVAAAREALTNARKHARAHTVTVVCEVAEGTATLTVEDDGRGFDPAAVRRGTGLRESIAGRLARLGGCAVVDARPGRGTSVRLRVDAPLAASAPTPLPLRRAA